MPASKVAAQSYRKVSRDVAVGASRINDVSCSNSISRKYALLCEVNAMVGGRGGTLGVTGSRSRVGEVRREPKIRRRARFASACSVVTNGQVKMVTRCKAQQKMRR